MFYKSIFALYLIILTVTLGLISRPAQGATKGTTERVGVAAAINPTTMGTAPGASDRQVIPYM
jgi:hypothetical protein